MLSLPVSGSRLSCSGNVPCSDTPLLVQVYPSSRVPPLLAAAALGRGAQRAGQQCWSVGSAQGGTRCYRVNPLAIYAWRCLPRPERPDGVLGRHRRGLGDWCETLMPRTRQEMGDGAGSGAAVTPDACAGATALPGRAPSVRMARCDVPERWTVMSPSDGF